MVENPTEEEIQRILQESKTIAVVGLSPKEDSASHRVAEYLIKAGYRVVPVNPTYPEILGLKSYPSLSEVPDIVDIVDVFRRPEALSEIVDQAIDKKAKTVWMQEGIVNTEAAAKARNAGLSVVMDRCIHKTHKSLDGKI